MTEIKIENIVVSTKIADGLDINKIAENLPDFKFNPNEFNGLTLKLGEPKTAVLLLPGGKVICTGAKSFEDAEIAIKKAVERIKKIKIEVNKKYDLEIQNVVASTDLKKELHLSSISKGLLLEHVDYEPIQFPGLIYKMDDIGALILLFGSGKMVCTGAKNIENATNAIKIMKEKLSSLGAL